MPIPLILPHNLPLPPSSGLVSKPANPTAPDSAVYEVFVMDNTRTLVGIVDQYDKLSMIPRFNAVGSWALTLDAAHPMAANLKTRGYGIYVNRYIQDSNGYLLHADTPFFSGPMRNWVRENHAGVKTLTVSGGDCLLYVAERDAQPTNTFAYDGDVVALAPYAYYTFGDTSGTTAADTSGNARNGTYNGGFTLGQTTGLDDPETGVLFNGSTGYMDSGALGVGDGGAWASFCVHGWFVPSALPASGLTAKLSANSNTDSDLKGFKLQLNHDGTLTGMAGTGAAFHSVSTTAKASVGGIYYVVFQYDGANLSISLNAGTAITAAMTGTIVDNTLYHLQFGRGVLAQNYFHGKQFKWALHNGTLTPTQITNFYNAALSGAQIDVTTTGAAETVIWTLVNNNCAAGASTDRQVSGLSMATDNGNGSTVQATARYDNLVAKDGTGLIQELARASTPELGFHVTQSGTALTFAVYVPNDKTSNVLFSDEIGNLGDCTYEVDAPDYETEGNAVVVGGSGTGTSRTFYTATDSTSITNWGRAEAFVDKRDSSDPNVLATAADAALASFKEKATFNAQLIPQSGMTYGIDFALGDKVTCCLDGAVVVQDLVREVQIDLDPASGEVVTIAVGSDGAVAQPSGNPSITGKFYGPTNAATAKHGKQPKKHLKGGHHAKHLHKQARHQHRTNHSKQKLERRA